MPFSGFLSTFYGIQVEDKIWLDGKEGYRNGNYFYFITSTLNREMVYMEQTSLAYYLMDNNFGNVAIPIPNLQGEWFTPYHDNSYMVMQVQSINPKDNNRGMEGTSLANFHHIGARYQYQPREISSYGNWKSLWIDKLTVFERKIEEEASNHPCDYYQLLMDALPYVIGMSENAIQYIRESETETRFHEADQGTITFNRYTNQLNSSILWLDGFVYDHPSRDIAEHLRYGILQQYSQERMVSFMQDYQAVRPLSIFGLRLIYGRLLFPVHLFDLVNRGFLGENVDDLYLDLKETLDKQTYYEVQVGNFFEQIGMDPDTLDIPVLHWL